jgi:hypothetical protein
LPTVLWIVLVHPAAVPISVTTRLRVVINTTPTSTAHTAELFRREILVIELTTILGVQGVDLTGVATGITNRPVRGVSATAASFARTAVNDGSEIVVVILLTILWVLVVGRTAVSVGIHCTICSVYARAATTTRAAHFRCLEIVGIVTTAVLRVAIV